MKPRFLYAAFIVLTLALVSCQKNNDVNLSGKWQETKLTMYESDGTGTKLYDTTYTQPFTNLDYAEFQGGNKLTLGTDHYYYLNIPGQTNATQQITPVAAQWNYTALSARVFVLSTGSSLSNPGGFVVGDTITIVNPHLLWLHSVSYFHDGIHSSVSDSYYSK
jgi:hypothetical protein